MMMAVVENDDSFLGDGEVDNVGIHLPHNTQDVSKKRRKFPAPKNMTSRRK